MNEIKKLYELAGVKPVCDGLDCFTCTAQCNNGKYPEFTAEKQIAIVKLISKQGQVVIENWEKYNRGFNVTFRANSNLRYITMDCITRKTVEEALAQIVNDLWQDLTEKERSEIKKILKG